MRRIFFILSICMALAACDDVPVAGEGMVQGTHVLALDADLVRYDSIMQSRPDSALVLLLSYPAQKEDETLPDSLSVKNDGINAFAAMLNRNYFYLLVSEALFKTDNMQTVRPQVQQAECFFDSLAMQHPDNDDITFLSARSHYMNGVGFYENDSVVEACKEYLNALEIMEAHFNEDELVGQKAKFMALSYTRLTTLFSKHYLHEQAIYFGKIASNYYGKAETTSFHLPWMLNIIGTHYDALEQLDDAEYYYSGALLLISDTTNSLYRDIVTHLTFMEYKKTANSTVVSPKMHKLLSQSQNNTEVLSRSLTLGEIFYKSKQYDSAYVYINKVYERTNNRNAKIQAAEWLQKMCEIKGDNEQAMKYAVFLSQFATSSVTQSSVNSKLIELYKNHEQIRPERQNDLDNGKQTAIVKLSGGITILLILLIFVFIISIKHIKHKLHVQNAEKERLLEYSKNRESSLISDNKQLETRLRTLERKISTNIPEPAKIPYQEYRNLLQESICISIKQRFNQADIITSNKPILYKNLALSDKERYILFKTINTHCPDFASRLKKVYPQLTRCDIEMCIFYLLNLNNKQISVLIQRNYDIVWKRARHLEKSMNGIIEPYSQIISILFSADNQ